MNRLSINSVLLLVFVVGFPITGKAGLSFPLSTFTDFGISAGRALSCGQSEKDVMSEMFGITTALANARRTKKISNDEFGDAVDRITEGFAMGKQLQDQRKSGVSCAGALADWESFKRDLHPQ